MLTEASERIVTSIKNVTLNGSIQVYVLINAQLMFAK